MASLSKSQWMPGLTDCTHQRLSLAKRTVHHFSCVVAVAIIYKFLSLRGLILKVVLHQRKKNWIPKFQEKLDKGLQFSSNSLQPVIDPFYEKFVRKLLFRMDPEDTHEHTIHGLSWLSKLRPLCRWMHRFNGMAGPQPVRLFGLDFPNLVGLAAGLDKNAECLPAFAAMGFGHVEAGTVTPRKQPGNERPRLFRYPEEEAIINRMGFNNEGAEMMALRIGRSMPRKRRMIPVGINIGKARSTPLEDAVQDYLDCFRALADLADYFTVNISSPNTPGLRKLQEESYLRELLGSIQDENLDRAKRLGTEPVPILVKIAPDLDYIQIETLLAILLELGYDGVIATNTTIARPGTFKNVKENGGLSGNPLQGRSDKVIRFIHRTTGGCLPIIGVGGHHGCGKCGSQTG